MKLITYKVLTTLLVLFAILSMSKSHAGISLPDILSDNMVLQQDDSVVIWGWTTRANEKLKIWGSWNEDTVNVQANNGNWSAKIKTPSEKGPFKLHIKGHETLTINNILMGEVWLCSGQSNMEMPLDSISEGFQGVMNYKKVIENAKYPSIRYFQVSRMASDHPQDKLKGEWKVCNPENAKQFSATGYFFGKKIHEKMNVPVGLISSNWGGTNIETWIPDYIINNNPRYRKDVKNASEHYWWPNQPGKTYNGMIHPFIQYKIAGTIWYQGESNHFNPVAYQYLMNDLVQTWRAQWGYEFPFYWVQIAPHDYEGHLTTARIWESQINATALPKTGIALTNDLGNLDNIHPRKKEPIGHRLALLALNNHYDIEEKPVSGPLYQYMRVEKDKVRIFFSHTGNGLTTKGGSLEHFNIAGQNQNFVKAEAKIDGHTVVVSNKKISDPKAVRFAYADTAQHHLFNKAGMPATPFRTDEWELEK